MLFGLHVNTMSCLRGRFRGLTNFVLGRLRCVTKLGVSRSNHMGYSICRNSVCAFNKTYLGCGAVKQRGRPGEASQDGRAAGQGCPCARGMHGCCVFVHVVLSKFVREVVHVVLAASDQTITLRVGAMAAG